MLCKWSRTFCEAYGTCGRMETFYLHYDTLTYSVLAAEQICRHSQYNNECYAVKFVCSCCYLEAEQQASECAGKPRHSRP